MRLCRFYLIYRKSECLFKNDGNEFSIEEGEHIVKFTLGNYEVEKKFSAVKGQSYNVSLVIEAEITEEK